MVEGGSYIFPQSLRGAHEKICLATGKVKIRKKKKKEVTPGRSAPLINNEQSLNDIS